MDAIEKGTTAMITDRTSPAIRYLHGIDELYGGMCVVDYGAGNGRNADWLRAKGIYVYAYDPYNGSDCNGWDGVTNVPPTDADVRADVLYTTFVLNVLTLADEARVLNQIKPIARTHFHVVRNRDLTTQLWNGIRDGREPYFSQWESTASKSVDHMLENGFKTSRGFQRKVDLGAPHTCIQSTYGYKIYQTCL